METEQTNNIEKLSKDLGLEVVELRILLCKSFYDFLKEYLQFFGSKRSVENLCTIMVNDNVTRLYDGLNQCWISDKISVRYVDEEEWAKKHEHIEDCCTSSNDQGNEEEK
jgi:hypothetical protein